MRIAIDLDNTITAYPDVFATLTVALSNIADIHILTAREDTNACRIATEEELERLGIEYHVLKITHDKQAYILSHHVDLFIDDTDEFFLDLPESVCVLKIREPGNFDFAEKKWIYGNNTGINVDKTSK